jgi:crotonobetainyl-CoA:carnitine CoA-transferase CaiB-like acyl-CoA transferase
VTGVQTCALPISQGDPARYQWTPAGRVPAGFHAVNAHKKSLALNLAAPRGKAVFLDLLAAYDVVVEGFRPGVMDRLGLGYAALKARQPRLIYVALTGFGQDGPQRLRAGHDLTYQALAGALHLTGTPEGGPALPGLLAADLAGGSYPALVGLLAAVIRRSRTGQGAFIDVAMVDGLAALVSFLAAEVLLDGGDGRPGTTFPTGRYPCYGLYRTRDGLGLALSALEPPFWAEFCRTLGREDLLTQAFAGPEVRAELERLFAARTRAEWLEIFKDADCCLEPVLTLPQALAEPQARHRGVWREIEVQGRRLTVAGCPLKFEDYEPLPPRPGPGLGEQTEEVLLALGRSRAEIDRLRQEGVI